jgi:hypothetical protein
MPEGPNGKVKKERKWRRCSPFKFGFVIMCRPNFVAMFWGEYVNSQRNGGNDNICIFWAKSMFAWATFGFWGDVWGPRLGTAPPPYENQRQHPLYGLKNRLPLL